MAATDGHDVLIAGAGPSGTTAAILLARMGLDVAVFEKERFPRFQIGESFLPANYQLMERMGLEPKLRTIPHMDKYGAEFCMGGGEGSVVFRFNGSTADDEVETQKIDARVGGTNQTVNITRADFDQLLLDEARRAGATVHMATPIESIEQLDEGQVALRAGGRTVRGRFLLDASGYATLVGRHLKTRRHLPEPYFKKVAYFQHFENVKLLPGSMAGSPTIVMCDEGWFWIIPLSPTRSSVGMVVDRDVIGKAGVPARRMLRWGLQRCPAMAERMAAARGPETNLVRSDFSYRCDPYAGPGYFLLGDAALFLDPIFSSGVSIGMLGAERAAELIGQVLDGRISHAQAQRKYHRFMSRSSSYFYRAIRQFYRHPFRELFLSGEGPLQVHVALLAVLAGHVFPRPAFWIRWRYRLMELFVAAQGRVPLVPRLKRFSLLGAEPSTEVPEVAEVGIEPSFATA
ncbi:MAG: NAD(P)/FAD-dependent oxidoreductase [Phycisphaeraceae bacterium]|nr:NAD(P)/FAD-dependent oxidoreductase [Phycisphaeraceae bacterium]